MDENLIKKARETAKCTFPSPLIRCVNKSGFRTEFVSERDLGFRAKSEGSRNVAALGSRAQRVRLRYWQCHSWMQRNSCWQLLRLTIVWQPFLRLSCFYHDVFFTRNFWQAPFRPSTYDIFVEGFPKRFPQRTKMTQVVKVRLTWSFDALLEGLPPIIWRGDILRERDAPFSLSRNVYSIKP